MNAVIDQQADGEALRFITELARAVSAGDVELPAIPDVAARVRTALEDERVSATQIERIVSGEPVLASRIVRLANSAALNVSGRQVSDLRTAVARVGFAMVRTASTAYALAQLRNAEQLRGMERPLAALWSRSTLVAAQCRLVALRISHVNPDTAMFAGLLHGIGELYILTRAREFPALFSGDGARAVIRDWHGNVARAILENWDIAEEVVSAVAEFENYPRQHDGPVDLTDVLSVAYLVASYMDHPDSLELNMADVGICRRLDLTRADYETIISASREQIAALREALSY
jgi:HD-like signal output (HDOD) protein